MIAEILKLCGFGVLAALLCLIVKQVRPESAVFVELAAGAVILVSAVKLLSPSIKAMTELSEKAELTGELAGILMKALAICYITTLSADVARDAGETALGAKLELGGRLSVAVLSLPVFTRLAELITSILNG